MTPVIRIDDDVMAELKKRAVALGLVFEPPNATLRRVLGLTSERSDTESEVVGVARDASRISVEGGKVIAKKPATLVIHAPEYQAEKKSFRSVFTSRIGEDYIIYDKDRNRLQVPGSPVILLANDLKRRAEGHLVKLTPTTKTDFGRQRYDVEVDKWTEVDYKPERLNRCGVAII